MRNKVAIIMGQNKVIAPFPWK